MTKNWTPDDMPSLKGKVAIVTGANSGIGLHTAKYLALHGAKVYFTARSKEKAEAARNEMLSVGLSIPEGNLAWLQLDLCDLRSIKQAINTILSKESQLDILINNAGSLTPEMQTTKNGWEVDMASSYIGHFILTNGLMPLLKKAAASPSADVRVVTVGSNVPMAFLPSDYPIDFTTPSLLYGDLPYKPWQWRFIQNKLVNFDMLHYSLAKLANIMFAKELQNRLDKRNIPILSLTLNPGTVKTEGSKGLFKAFIQPIISITQLTPERGSYHTLWAATAKEVQEKREEYKGRYMEPLGKISPSHPVVGNSAQLAALWHTTTVEIKKQLDFKISNFLD